MSAKPKTDTAEGFVGSVFKFSISTFANIAIYALAILITGFAVAPDIYGPAELFINYTNTVMTIVILGLDQALIRFYYKPPAGLKNTGIFRLCLSFSSLVLLVAGVLGSTVLCVPLYNAMGFSAVGYGIMPLLFINAFFFMILRYFNVLFRMEMNIKVYTIESVLMQFFYKLFYLLGVFLPFANPVAAMIACSMVGLGGFALVFCIWRRKVLRPRLTEYKSGAYKTLLPYGIAVAPTAVFVTLNGVIPKTIISGSLDSTSLGVYSFAYSLSNMVTLIQGGFAAFWGAFMFENYDTQQERICRVHDYLNLVILAFFSFLVAIEDIMFWFLSLFNKEYYDSISIFPLLMLGAVFTILCETTVYGNAIAKKPILDTIGIGLSFLTNLILCIVLVQGGRFGIIGAATAVVSANIVMFLFRTFTAQKLYKSINNPAKTFIAIAMATVLGILGVVFAYQPLVKVPVALACLVIYCLMYRPQFLRLWKLAISILKGIVKKKA